MDSTEELVRSTRSALVSFPCVSFAILFGSATSGRLRDDSDLDIALYLDSGGVLEIEEERTSSEETSLQIALERATHRNVDLLVLNRAPATVCAAACLSGTAIEVRDRALYTRYFLAITNVAIDFLKTEREFREIRKRSKSLLELDRSRLLRTLEFITEELQDRPNFRMVDRTRYRSDRDMRRSFDRWVETLTNAAIDTAKIVLASEKRPVPQTYGQILSDLETLPAFSTLSGRPSHLAPLRNTLAQEYLDLRFGRIKAFAETDSYVIDDLAAIAKLWLG